jgi:hypothetical protein
MTEELLEDLRFKRRDRKVFESSKGIKRFARGVGVSMAVLLPGLMFYFEALGYTVSCDPAKDACEVVEHRLGRNIRTAMPFANIKGVHLSSQKFTDTRHGRTEIIRTGRYVLVFEKKNGEKLVASTPAEPEIVHRDGLKALIDKGEGDAISIKTSVSVGDMGGVIAFFVLGLLLIAMSFWRTVLEYEKGTGLIEIKSARWPMVPRKTLSCPGQDIKSVDVKGNDFIYAVRITLQSGKTRSVARFATRSAHDVAGELRGFSRRAKAQADGS